MIAEAPAPEQEVVETGSRIPVIPSRLPGEAIQEIVTYTPGSLLRWGITALAITLLILLLVSWMVSYPELVRGRFTVTTQTPPSRLVAQVAGEVERLPFREGEHVAAGAPLVVFRSATSYDTVTQLVRSLDAMDSALRAGKEIPDADPALPMGSLQDAYAEFLQSLSDFRELETEFRYFDEKRVVIAEQLDAQVRLGATLSQQQRLLSDDMELARRELERRRRLNQNGLLALTDVETAEKAYLQQRVATETGQAALSRNRIEIAGYRSAALELDRQINEMKRKRFLDLRKAIQSLRSAITSWENLYVIKAPYAGTVSFFRELHPTQHVAAHQPVVAVLPHSADFVARVKLDQRNAGKVEEGQRVILRFDSYPYRQFGTVMGKVASMSRLGMTDDKEDQTIYLLDVELPQGLITSYKVKLDFRQELRGDADIVTAERRLLQRLFDQLRLTE
ncbi:MAG TPA: HlyD family efflux transporter periplasmic adaptor subunit [Thermoanaerobaculia bacterium]|jgi:multidrug resistance efflux pump